MKRKSCDGEMIQKSRVRLAVVGIFVLASFALAFVIPHFWMPAVILAFTGAYLILWPRLVKGAGAGIAKSPHFFDPPLTRDRLQYGLL
jgi:hypothetical protein